MASTENVETTSQGPTETGSGGELTTHLGCTIKVIPGLYDIPDRTALVLWMGQPGDGRRAEVLLTDDERAKLKAIL